jgi:DNA-directed RNA polymerase subunit L
MSAAPRPTTTARPGAAAAAAAPQTLAARRAAAAGTQGRGAATAMARRRAAAAATATENIFHDVTSEGPTMLRFRLAPSPVEYANALRRTMITEVETVGFRADILDDGSTADVKITRNSTPMSNEMLAHRIGLLPIHVKEPLQWNPDQFTFKLDITNEDAAARDIVAADITVLKNRGPEEDPLPVPSVEFFHPDPVTRDTTLLTVLKGRTGTQEPESLTFTAKATLGTGRQNARFMPVTSRCAYGYTIDDNDDRRKEIFNRWLSTSKKISPSELEGDSDKKAALDREFNTMEYQRCYKIDEAGEPYSYDFTVESVGVLDPTYIVARALDILQAKLLKYASIDSGQLPEGLRVVPAEARGKMFDFVFQGEDHTLGITLQTWLDINLMPKEQISFVGCKVPHPLRDEMVLRVGVESGKDVDARAAVATACREAAQMFKNWAAMWAGASGFGGYARPAAAPAAPAPAAPVPPAS